ALRRAHAAAFLRAARRRRFAVFPGTRELLAELRRRGLRVALATSSKDGLFRETQASAGIDLPALVDLTVTGEEAGATKPAADLVLTALARLELPPSCSLFVGDTTHDVEAAGRADVPCIGLTCGGCASEAQLRAAGALAVFRDPQDLLDNLGGAARK